MLPSTIAQVFGRCCETPAAAGWDPATGVPVSAEVPFAALSMDDRFSPTTPQSAALISPIPAIQHGLGSRISLFLRAYRRRRGALSDPHGTPSLRVPAER